MVLNNQILRKVIIGSGLITFHSRYLAGTNDWTLKKRLWTLLLLHILVRCFLVEKNTGF